MTNQDDSRATVILGHFDLEGIDAQISFKRWLVTLNGQADSLTVEISNDAGQTWTLVDAIDTSESAWVEEAFFVSAFVTPTSLVQVRFGIADEPNDSLTEGGIDDFFVREIQCNSAPVAQASGSRYIQLESSNGVGEYAVLVEGVETDDQVACVSGYVQLEGTIGPDPVFQDAATWGAVVEIGGTAIVPDSSYAISFDTGTPGNPLPGDPAVIQTYAWGDVDQNAAVNFADVQLIVLGFQGNFDNATLQQVDLAPCTPNGVANFEDVLAGVQAFQGGTFADFGCAWPCP